MTASRILLQRNPLPVHRVGTLVAGGVFAAGEYFPVTGVGGGVAVSSAGMNATQGWFAACVRMNWADASEPLGGANYPYLMAWGTGFDLAYEESSNRFIIVRNAADIGYQAGSETMVPGEIVVPAFRWTASMVSVSVDGGAFNDTAAATTTAVADATFNIGCDQANIRQFSSYLRGALWGNGTLDTQTASLINHLFRTDHPSPARYLPASAGVLGEWLCADASYRTAR